MIQKSIDQIDKPAIDALVTNSVSERLLLNDGTQKGRLAGYDFP
jgi:hypothetical protein